MLGFLTMLLAAGFLSIQNVLVRIFFQGNADFGGILPSNFEHTVLFLQTRTFFMTLFISLLAWRIYPKTFLEIARGGTHLKFPILSGSIYFVTVILLYLALGNIPAGIAITLFFIHPIVAMLWGWWFERDRPTVLRLGIITGVIIGLILVTPQLQASFSSEFTFGVSCALGAGIGFGLYAVTAQNALIYFHPLSFSLITFALLFVSSSLVTLLLSIKIPAAIAADLLTWSAGSGIITLGGLVFTNVGIRLVGAATATLVGAIEPALTAILAWMMIQETLEIRQMIGIGIVTLSIASLGFHRQKITTHQKS